MVLFLLCPGGGVLGDSFGSLRHSVFGQFPGQNETNGGLDVPGADGSTLSVLSQLGGLSCNLLEGVIGKGVHDAHGLAGDAGVGVNLLENFVDVDGVGLLPLLPLGALALDTGRTSSLLLDRAWDRSGIHRSRVSGSLNLNSLGLLLDRLLSRHLRLGLAYNCSQSFVGQSHCVGWDVMSD